MTKCNLSLRLIVAFISFLPVHLYAQVSNDSDSITSIASGNVSISSFDYMNLMKDAKILKATRDSLLQLRCDYKSLQAEKISLETSLIGLDAQVRTLKSSLISARNEMAKLTAHPVETDKKLISMASNFIYIPYEAYSIDSIAIPAFKSVQSDSLKLQYADRLLILEVYYLDLVNIEKFIDQSLNVKNKIQASSKLELLRTMPTYQRYKDNDELEGAFIQQLLLQIESQLKEVEYQRKNGVDFSEIHADIKKCLKTKE